MLTRTTSLALALLLASSALAGAGQYNQRGLSAKNAALKAAATVQVKTMKLDRNQLNGNFNGVPPCGVEQNGATIVKRGNKTVVLADDITNFGGKINIGRDCQ